MVFVVRDPSALSRFDPAQKVLKASDVSAWREAQGIVADAMSRRDDILREAQQAYEEEECRGYAEGAERARQEQSARMLGVVAQTADYFARVEQRMVDLVLNAVQCVVDSFDERDRVAALVQRSLAEVRTQKQVTLRVHPDHVASMRVRMDTLIEPYPAIECVDVVGDARLEADACAVETDIGIVEASVEGQMSALREAFRSAFDERA